jgi:2-polyprenyl-6-methoxyphenol hydroxylase-like FAD-dependent oxidoreductase
MDPVTGQGISDALRDAELLADAIAAALGGGRPLERALREYQRTRDQAVKPMYDFTTEIASLARPTIEQNLLFEALERDPRQTQRFLGMLTGAVPIGEFFSSSSLRRLIGLRGFAKIAASHLRPRRHAAGPAPRTEAAGELREITDGAPR